MELTRELVRKRARLPLKLPIRVVCRESAEYEWTEQTRLIDVNQFGAGFTLTRPVEVGRLIHLTIPLPHPLRCFDHFELLYSVWGLVRHVTSISSSQGQERLFRIGVGFVGKDAPQSYKEDPTTRYEPLSVKPGQNSMMALRRSTSAIQRRETRLIIPLEVLVEILDENGKPIMKEHTVTETISSLGTCLPTSLDVAVGRIVRITSAIDQVSIFAAIRTREIALNGITRLGLEFIGDRWPLQRDSRFMYRQRPVSSGSKADVLPW